MTIEPGTTLLHYRVVDKVGEGGMGVVWRAVDTTLDREVAIKVLPDWAAAQPAGAAGPAIEERLARFDREAKLLASLNHPNIAAVYGLHEVDGQRFLAMELVPGEDLAERLRTGRLPQDDALAVARQVASALAAAHDSGVIHRDLKPANIRITPEGTVKVLDFGLAKAFDVTTESGGSVDPSLSPTLTSAGTRVGVILGTAAYMSPEQARGRAVDRRTDIWAFGCVLYEMLTGRAAFVGETVTDVLAAILKTDVDLDALPPDVSRRLRRLLQRCLERDPGKRLRDAADIRLEIESVLAGDPGAPEIDAVPTRRPWALLAVATVAALALGFALAALTGVGAGKVTPGEPRRVTVTTGDGRPIVAAGISRAGDFLVLLLRDGAYLRRLDDFGLTAIPDSEHVTSWVASPDGSTIAFFTMDDQILGSGKLRSTSLATGTTTTIGSFSDQLYPVSWEGGAILAADTDGEVLRLDPETGGASNVLFKTEKGHFHSASKIPGTEAMLLDMHSQTGGVEWLIEAVDLATSERHEIVSNATGGVIAASGHLLFLREGTLLASGFDRETLRVVGSPVPILSGVRSFSVADDGTLAYIPSGDDTARDRVVEIDASGEREVYEGSGFRHIRYAPDGRWISVIVTDAVLLVDREGGSTRRLTNSGASLADHVWRPDGHAVIYAAYVDNGSRCVLFEQPVDGSAPRALLETDAKEAEIFPTGYAPDGSGFVFARYEGKDADLWWHPADGGEARSFLATEASEDLARFSPDGRLVAYESNASGRQEVWVGRVRTDEHDVAETWQISQTGGKDPLWSPDGGTLYFEDLDERLLAVPVGATGRGEPTFGAPDLRYDMRALGAAASGDESYDVAPTGERIVFIRSFAGESPEVRVVFDWFTELRRLVPSS